MKMKMKVLTSLLLTAGLLPLAAQAADWSDTSIGYRYGTQFAEPYDTKDIAKNIFSLTHVSGYKYGTNFFNVDLLQSDKNDPAQGNSGTGAQEAYVVYRHTLDIGKVMNTDLSFGPFKGVGATAGFDWNTKNDSYGSRKRMLVAGPTLFWNVPAGFVSTSLLALWESNAPDSIQGRYSYDVHPMLNFAWAVPIGSLPLSFEGFANFIASKGKDEFGGDTAPETNIDMQIMWDAGSVMGMGKNTFKVGLEYQYWKNKFGNNANGPAGSGAFAKTPMVRAEYHF